MPLNNPFGGPQWTEDHCADLTQLCAAGVIYREIARTLNEKYGTNYSKNSVVGKVCRLGLTPPAKPKVVSQPRKSHKSKGVRAYVAKRATHNGNVMRLFPAIELDQPRCVEVVPQHVSLVDLTGCKYPYGDGPFTFCNHERTVGSSYCVDHFDLSRRPALPLKSLAFKREGTDFARTA